LWLQCSGLHDKQWTLKDLVKIRSSEDQFVGSIKNFKVMMEFHSRKKRISPFVFLQKECDDVMTGTVACFGMDKFYSNEEWN